MSARNATRSAGLVLALMLVSVYLVACRGKATPEAATPQPETVLTAAAMTANAQLSLTAQASATNMPQATPTQQATIAVTPSPALTQPGLTPTALSTAEPGGSDLAAYASDVTIPDGTIMDPGEAFLKTWRLSNIGTSTWTTQYALTFVEGEQMSGPASVPLTTNVPPGGAVDISVNLVAPQTTGTHRGYWQMRNANGQLFITAIWVEINVGGSGGSPTEEGGATKTPAPGGSVEVSDVSLEVDDASASGCPHTFSFTGSLKLSQAANVTYQLEAESDDPGFELDLPAPVTANLAAGVHEFAYTLDISDSFSGWAQFHVTSPEDVISDAVGLTLECDSRPGNAFSRTGTIWNGRPGHLLSDDSGLCCAPMSPEQDIKSEARRLGFALAGLTSPDPPPHLGAFQAWLEAGRHGEMVYLETEHSRLRREDPRRILPECETILVVAMPYPASGLPEGLSATGAGGPRGRVASYAWGDDYHAVLVPRLESLVAFIRARLGEDFPYRVYSDTGPLLERDLAQRAGLGWIGKNTCLINPRQGSYFLLGEALLGVALQPDPPFLADRCGSCTRCLQACPTACILPDRTLDARRCISYLTIEHKGAIPRDLRPQMGNWIFGCDICQQVCPWNRFAAAEGDPAYAPRQDLPAPDLNEALRLSEDAFRDRFRGSPVKRAKRRGYLRNAAVALGNSAADSPESSAVSPLASIMGRESEPLVRQHAAWALGRIGGPAARRALEAALASEQDLAIREEIQAALVP